MTANNETVQLETVISAGKPVRPQRRVGTFTFGVTLLAAGAAMLSTMFFPAFPPERFLQASPVILILLGLEVLLSLPKGGKIKYDWVGMLLCVLLVGAAIGLYSAAWYFSEDGLSHSRITRRFAGEDSYSMAFEIFNGYDNHILHLQSGDVLRGAFTLDEGQVDVVVCDQEGVPLLEDTVYSDSWERLIEIPSDGDYWVQIEADYATGSLLFGTIEPESPDSAEQP